VETARHLIKSGGGKSSAQKDKLTTFKSLNNLRRKGKQSARKKENRKSNKEEGGIGPERRKASGGPKRGGSTKESNFILLRTGYLQLRLRNLDPQKGIKKKGQMREREKACKGSVKQKSGQPTGSYGDHIRRSDGK